MSVFIRLGRAVACAAIAALPLTAHAQHVVTEAEASKLTLEALTATPAPVYRPAYRSYVHSAMATTRAGRRGGHVQRVAYRPTAHAASHARHHRR